MSDDPHDEFPLVPRDDVRDALGSAPQAITVPDADRKRLEALLQELLRHDCVREVLCAKEELALQQGDAE
ncbi:MAG TPA: hypothetical protein VKX28_23755 [Xanthobacteraceae bacterium]|nr:hypothetical protein [Xanthobacteraceae bacterium]